MTTSSSLPDKNVATLDQLDYDMAVLLMSTYPVVIVVMRLEGLEPK